MPRSPEHFVVVFCQDHPLADVVGRLSPYGAQVAAEPPKGGALSQLEQNRVLKQRLQECCVLIPLEFLDPITLEIIAEPVIAGDGVRRASLQQMPFPKAVLETPKPYGY